MPKEEKCCGNCGDTGVRLYQMSRRHDDEKWCIDCKRAQKEDDDRWDDGV